MIIYFLILLFALFLYLGYEKNEEGLRSFSMGKTIRILYFKNILFIHREQKIWILYRLKGFANKVSSKKIKLDPEGMSNFILTNKYVVFNKWVILGIQMKLS
jgi:hypothetical protein